MLTGKYYNGQSSKPHLVLINIDGGTLTISPFNSLSGNKIKWDITKIKSESFTSTNKVMLTYGDEFPFQKLEFQGSEANEILNKVLKNEHKIKGIEQLITKANPVRIVLISLVVLVTVVAGYVFLLSPVIGEQAVKLLPRSIEEKAGKTIYNNMDFFIKKDSAKSELLVEFFEVCGFESDYNIRIDYSKSNTVNAFALPGGQIVVFKGIIDELESWEELAALLGHELAHVNQRHSFKQLSRNFSSYFIISVLTGDVAGVSAIVLEQASQINQLSNSRKYEKEADIIGLDYLKKSQIEPSAMINLFEMLNEQSNSDLLEKLEYISTHPLSTKRIEYLEETIASDQSFNYSAKEISRAKAIFEELKRLEDSKNLN